MKTLNFKSVLILAASLLLSQSGYSQKALASPRDSVSGTAGKASIHINYGSPSVKGRTIWGGLVPYNTVWRAGANEATTFSTSQPLQVEGKMLPAGTYALFMIPGEKSWTVIFNKTAKQWGAYEYDVKQDALRVTVTPRKAEAHERLKYVITTTGFSLFWENLEVPVTVH